MITHSPIFAVRRAADSWARSQGFEDASVIPPAEQPRALRELCVSTGENDATMRATLVELWGQGNERGQALQSFSGAPTASAPSAPASGGRSQVEARLQPTRGKDYGAPTTELPRFSAQKYWDADSTPPALACLSRSVGRLFPSSGARTPAVEAGIVLASLMHDVAYYYGGNSTDRDNADRLFGAQIPWFVGLIDKSSVEAARTAACVDEAAVNLGGGFPFRESYSWSYGWKKNDRGYASLNPGENERVRAVARESLAEVVGAIAASKFTVSGILKEKLQRATPAHQEAVKAAVVEMAKALKPLLDGGGAGVPGF